MQRSYLAENVSAGVPESVAAFVGFKSEELELTIRLQRPRHVPENPIDLRNQSVGSQTLRNLSRNVQGRCHPLLPFLHSPIRQRNPSKKKKKIQIRIEWVWKILGLGLGFFWRDVLDGIGGEREAFGEEFGLDGLKELDALGDDLVEVGFVFGVMIGGHGGGGCGGDRGRETAERKRESWGVAA